jgi:hypothetical protein
MLNFTTCSLFNILPVNLFKPNNDRLSPDCLHKVKVDKNNSTTLHVFPGFLFLVRAVVALIVIPKGAGGTGIMVAPSIYNADLMG